MVLTFRMFGCYCLSVVVFCLLVWFKLIVLVCIRLNSLSGVYVFCLVFVVGCLFIWLFVVSVSYCLVFTGVLCGVAWLCCLVFVFGWWDWCSDDFPVGVRFGLLVCW